MKRESVEKPAAANRDGSGTYFTYFDNFDSQCRKRDPHRRMDAAMQERSGSYRWRNAIKFVTSDKLMMPDGLGDVARVREVSN